MRAILQINQESNGSVALRLVGDSTNPMEAVHIPKASVSVVKADGKKIREYNAATALSARLISEFTAHAVPEALDLRIRQWSLLGAGSPILCVQCMQEELAALPWEVLPKALGIPAIVVTRLTKNVHPVTQASVRSPAQLVVASWSKVPGYDRKFPGIVRELQGLASSFGMQLNVEVLSEPTWNQLEEVVRKTRPEILHLPWQVSLNAPTDCPECGFLTPMGR